MESSLFTTVLLPLSLATVMLGMGLGLTWPDFTRLLRDPKAVFIGVGSQLVLLPLLGWLIATLSPLQPELAVGLVVLAACPGGPSSNVMTYLAEGDVALSVTLTAITSFVTILTVPVLTTRAVAHFLGESAAVMLPLAQTVLQILAIMVVPTTLGMVVRARIPKVAHRLERQVSRLALGLLGLIILLLLVRQGSQLPSFVAQVGIPVLVLNLGGMGLGWAAGLGLPPKQRLCIALEVGIQNGTLAIVVTASLLNSPDMAIPAAVYSLLMYFSGAALIAYGRRRVPA